MNDGIGNQLPILVEAEGRQMPEQTGNSSPWNSPLSLKQPEGWKTSLLVPDETPDPEEELLLFACPFPVDSFWIMPFNQSSAAYSDTTYGFPGHASMCTGRAGGAIRNSCLMLGRSLASSTCVWQPGVQFCVVENLHAGPLFLLRAFILLNKFSPPHLWMCPCA